MRDNESERDLNNETCSLRLDDNVREPVRDLKSEVCSARPDTRDMEPVRVLKNELCSPLLMTMPREPDRFFAKLLTSEPVIDSEPDSVLESESCLERLEDEPSDALRALPIPFA